MTGRGWIAAVSGGVRFGRPAGPGVLVTWSWPLSVLVIGILATPLVRQVVPGLTMLAAVAVAAALGMLLGLCVLVHEWGHVVVARKVGLPVVHVRLYLLGGVTELGRQPTRARDELLISAAGPLLSAVLGGVFWWLVTVTERGTVLWLMVLELALANLVIAVFNVLPALPLDGGRVLRAGIWQLTGHRRWGTVAGVVGAGVVTVGLVWWSVTVIGEGPGGWVQAAVAVGMALFLLIGAVSEQRAEALPQWPSDLPLARLARPVLVLPAEIPIGLAVEAAGARILVLTAADQVVVGLVDPRELPQPLPQAHRPAGDFATSVPPQAVVLPDDDPAELLDRLAEAGPLLLLVDAEGLPSGVVPAQDVARVLARR